MIIGVVGLSHLGLVSSIAFSKKIKVLAFDKNLKILLDIIKLFQSQGKIR